MCCCFSARLGVGCHRPHSSVRASRSTSRRSTDQGRRAAALEGDGDRELPDRRLRSAAHRLAEHQGSRRLGAEDDEGVGPRQRRTSRRGPFGRGWKNERFAAHMTLTPRAYPLIGYPKAWTPGTNGAGHRRRGAGDRSQTRRRTSTRTAASCAASSSWRRRCATCRRSSTPLAGATPTPSSPSIADAAGGRRAAAAAARRGGRRDAQDFARKRTQFLVDEGVAAVLEPGTRRRRHGLRPGRRLARSRRIRRRVPQVVLAVEHYDRIVAHAREEDSGHAARSTSQNRFYDDDLNAFNVVAEIPGTDKADEVVMLGAHFDSWHAGTGATDNAAGSAVMMEAMRILKATGARSCAARSASRCGAAKSRGCSARAAYVKRALRRPRRRCS